MLDGRLVALIYGNVEKPCTQCLTLVTLL